MTRPAPTPSLHVVHLLSSLGVGGQERVALDLVACQVRAGRRVTVLSLAPPPDGPLGARFVEVGARVERVARAREGLDPGLVARLARWLGANGTDLLHTHNPMALLYGAPAARLARVAVVHTKHGSNPAGRARLQANRLAARWVDAFVAVSPETAAVARERREVAEGRLSVIPNGIALERFQPDGEVRRRIREELAIEPGARVIGTVGRLAEEKDQALLLRAAAPLLGPATRLVLTGDGPLRGALGDLSASLGISPWVHFLGNRDDVPAVLNAMDLFVLSSRTEGLPLVVPEAMATALPVVTTRVGGLAGVVDEGVTGFLVPARDEEALRARIASLLADPGAARTLGGRARTVALERYSAQRMHAAYEALYRGVLEARSGQGRTRPGA